MFKWRNRVAAAILGLATALGPSAGKSSGNRGDLRHSGADADLHVALRCRGRRLLQEGRPEGQTRNLVGVASPNAVLAGSADFTFGTGPVFLRAASQGQRFLAIANMVDRPMVEMVLRKDVAERLGITPQMPPYERAKRLKGTTIAIQGVGSIVHAWERYVVGQQPGSTSRRTSRIAPMDPPAMLPALREQGRSTATPPPCRSRRWRC